MVTKAIRMIVRIDEEKCDGCGLCVPSCAEGAIQIIEGKARLIGEKYCDGLGACLGECPQGAITIEEREAEGFDEEAARHHLEERESLKDELPCGCTSTTVVTFEKQELGVAAPRETKGQPSLLGHWPVQLTLVPIGAPFLRGSDLLLTADCVPFAYAGFHQDFLRDHSLLVACPKLDDFQAHLMKLAEVLRHSRVNSLTVVHMEVPCCFGLVQMAQEAIRLSGQDVPFRKMIISVRGGLKA